MAFVTTRGARFHTVELGQSGPPVVMLHGLFTGSLASWYFTAAPALAKANRVRLIDWRGHGLSDRTRSGYTSAEMAGDLAELTADLPEFAVVGHSFGSLVALRFALAHPDRLTRIALIDPPLTTGPLPLDRLGELIHARQSPPAGGTRLTGGDLVSLLNSPLLAETTLLADLDAEAPLTDGDLASLPYLPMLAVAGSGSPLRGSLDRIGRIRPATRRHLLTGGHDLHVTAKDELVALLTEFLDG